MDSAPCTRCLIRGHRKASEDHCAGQCPHKYGKLCTICCGPHYAPECNLPESIRGLTAAQILTFLVSVMRDGGADTTDPKVNRCDLNWEMLDDAIKRGEEVTARFDAHRKAEEARKEEEAREEERQKRLQPKRK